MMKLFKQIFIVLTIFSLITTIYACSNNQNGNVVDPSPEDTTSQGKEATENEGYSNNPTHNEEPLSENDKEVAKLIDNFYTYLNSGDRLNFKNLFGKKYKKNLANFAEFKNIDKNSEPYDMGECLELERIQIDYDELISNGWSNVADYDPGYTDVRFYVDLYNYKPGDASQIYVYVKEGVHYNYFIIGKKNNKYKIISVIPAYDMTKLVEIGKMPYHETTEGEMTPLDVQLFGEKFPVNVMNQETGDYEFAEYNGFFNSIYSDPKEMNFEAFMWCFTPRQSLEQDEKEYREVEKLEKEKHGTGFPEGGLYTPLWKYKREDVDRVLQKYADITTADLGTESTEYLLYSKEYDSYYNFTSDVRAGTFTPDSGYIEGGVYIMTELNANSGSPETHKTITKFKRVGDKYKILSREIAD